jgi:cardiolipin synthase
MIRVKIVVMERNLGGAARRRLSGVGGAGHLDESVDGAPDPTVVEVDTIWTVPNLFTLIRLLCLPLFLYLLFVLPSRQAAAWLLGGLGATDWIDGYLARRLGQTSEFGKKFDPTVDRILFVVGIVAIIVNDSIPLWFALAVLAREVLVGGSVAVATLAFGMERFDVTWWGKTATFLMMFAVPGFLMAESTVPLAGAFEVAAWCFGIPGLILSYYTGAAYIPAIRDGVKAGRRS